MSEMPVPGTRTVRRQVPSAPRLTRNGPAPKLVDTPRLLNVNRTGPNDLDLRNCAIDFPLLTRPESCSDHSYLYYDSENFAIDSAFTHVER
jgi:hypothetical protein